MPIAVERISLSDVRAAEPDQIWYSVNTCWWTHRKEDLRAHRKSGLPCDPRGGMLMMTNRGSAEGFLDDAEANPQRYGKHGIRAFMAAHNDNCVVSHSDNRNTCLAKWSDYEALIDELDRRKAGMRDELHSKLRQLEAMHPAARRASIQELRDILADLVGYVHGGKTRPDRLVLRVPADPGRDWDLLFSAAIAELAEFRGEPDV